MTNAQDCPPEPAIRVVMMPRDTNVMGTIFGGVLLSYISLEGDYVNPIDRDNKGWFFQFLVNTGF